MATAEENADGGVIVTTPTCGASGVLPALLYAMRYDMHIGDRAVREGFWLRWQSAFWQSIMRLLQGQKWAVRGSGCCVCHVRCHADPCPRF